MYQRTETILRIAVFCLSPKGAVRADAIVCFTGDGDELAQHTFRVWSASPLPHPQILITGADSGLCEGNTASLNATDLKNWLTSAGVPSDLVITDDEAHNTLDQAENLVWHAAACGWQNVILIASGYHIIRAWLTVVKAIKKKGLRITVIPEPSYLLSFLGPNNTLSRQSSTWHLFIHYTLPRIPRYQRKGDVATWREAAAYLKECGL